MSACRLPTRRAVWLALGCAPLAALPRRAGAVPALALANVGAVVPAELLHALPGAQLRGEATLRYLGLRVYDIRLWAGGAQALARPESARLALELRYARALPGGAIAERSLQEMQGIGEVAPAQAERWLGSMRAIFPDVTAGDRLSGLQMPGEGARFWINGRAAGEVQDAEFARLFFGIWLSPRSSQPRLREALLGARAPA